MTPPRVCKRLRSKKMIIAGLAAEALARLEDEPWSSGHCWCNCTLTVVGPDDQPVGLQVCTASRSCFEE